METSRIAELLQPFLDKPGALSAAQLTTISMYIDLLLRWNARINLTSVRQPEAIVTRHFGESLFAARHLFPDRVGTGTSRACPERSQRAQPASLIDIGSGAGFPGVPIKLWAPRLHLTLIESNHKKVAFLRQLARSLTLTDIDIVPAAPKPTPASSPTSSRSAPWSAFRPRSPLPPASSRPEASSPS